MDSIREDLFQVSPIFIAMSFFVIIFTLNWFGYRTRKRAYTRAPDKEVAFGAAEGSLLGLMALLLAFSFGMSTTKFEARRQLIVDEANLINTAILRYYLYPDSVRQSLLPDFKNYLDSRIRYFDAGDNPAKIKATLDDAGKDFNDIWNKTVLLARNIDNKSRAEQMVPVLISMNNIVTTREAGRVAAVPSLILIVLLLLVFSASFLTGFGTKPGNRNRVFAFAFAFMTTVVLYLVMELSRPRQGYINLGNAEQNLVNLKKKLS
ncbi:MAG: hypothetical protein ACJ75B_17990 [Flavisolibacter sp.]